MKKIILSSILFFAVAMLTACGQRTENTTGEEAGPGPVTESDEQRYNLNPADKMHHETLRDSVLHDTLPTDTL